MALEEIDAYQVIVNEDEREAGDDRIADLEMVLISKRGQDAYKKG